MSTRTLPDPRTPAFHALATTLKLAVSPLPTIGEQLAVYRLARGTTQSELAALAGLKRQAAISDIEHARGDGHNPTLATLAALATALGQALVVLPE